MIGLSIENGVVTNSAIFDELPEGWVADTVGAGIGWTYDGTTFTPPLVVEEPLSAEEKVANMTQEVQNHIDTIASTLGFDSIHSAAIWRDSANVSRQARATAIVSYGNDCWDVAEGLLAGWQSGDIVEPTKDVVLAALPLWSAYAPV